jgi:hypothetical protein
VFEKLNPEWETVAGMRTPRRLDAPAHAGGLGLCDASALPKFGMAGPCAAEWLAVQGISVPGSIYAWCALRGDTGLIVRLPFDEFFIEDGPEDLTVPVLKANLGDGQAGCYPIERQDAGLLVCEPEGSIRPAGAAITALMEQCCAVELARERGNFLMTRVAGVNSMLLWRPPALRLWCSASVAIYLWETLCEIAHDLGGDPVGLASAQRRAIAGGV